MNVNDGTGRHEREAVIIIGGPRSGTNMLRDVLTQIPGVASWPCDEINYIWRHGNVRYSSDEFMPAMATPAIRCYICRQFAWVGRRYDAQTVVEKTCANSLRGGCGRCLRVCPASAVSTSRRGWGRSNEGGVAQSVPVNEETDFRPECLQ
ncbi:MAG: hypothetical protein J5I81_01195 [Nitrococcus mobilis]|nr:hypothetical protein [Nitrococcus mobilis]